MSVVVSVAGMNSTSSIQVIIYFYQLLTKYFIFMRKDELKAN